MTLFCPLGMWVLWTGYCVFLCLWRHQRRPAAQPSFALTWTRCSQRPHALHVTMLTHSLILPSYTLHICSFVITNSFWFTVIRCGRSNICHDNTLTLPIERDLTKSFYMLLLSNNELHVFHCFPPPLSNWTCGPMQQPTHTHTHIFTCARTFLTMLLNILWGKKTWIM